MLHEHRYTETRLLFFTPFARGPEAKMDRIMFSLKYNFIIVLKALIHKRVTFELRLLYALKILTRSTCFRETLSNN